MDPPFWEIIHITIETTRAKQLVTQVFIDPCLAWAVHWIYITLKPTNHVSLASEITIINVFYVLMLDHVRLVSGHF